MALVKCPDCGKEVSDAATTCIGCGRPLHAPEAAQPATILIEGSAKRYKRNILVGLAGIPTGFIVSMIGGGMHSSALLGLGLLIGFTGIVWFIINLIARWYQHA